MKRSIVLLSALACLWGLAGCSVSCPAAPENTSVEPTFSLAPTPSETANVALIPMVMADGTLYLDTGYLSGIAHTCGTMDGEITTQVDVSQRPTEDGQSNFTSGCSYQYGYLPGTIEVKFDGKWCIFAEETARKQLHFSDGDGETLLFRQVLLLKDDLSEDTLAWVAWYNALTEEELLAVDSIPDDLYDLWSAAVNDAEPPAAE